MENKLALSDAELAQVKSILKSHLPGVRVVVFGSRAGGKPGRGSDLDLALMVATPIPVDTLGHLRDAFTNSTLNFRVDLLDWARTTEEFRNLIRAHQVEIQTESGGMK